MDSEKQSEWLRELAATGGRNFSGVHTLDRQRLNAVAARLEELERENQRLRKIVDEWVDTVELADPGVYRDMIEISRAALQPAPEGWEKV